jgi:hypothetical protein
MRFDVVVQPLTLSYDVRVVSHKHYTTIVLLITWKHWFSHEESTHVSFKTRGLLIPYVGSGVYDMDCCH